jgi:hypothetical protein
MPIRIQRWHPVCIIEIDREDFGKLLHSKWPDRNN